METEETTAANPFVEAMTSEVYEGMDNCAASWPPARED